MATYIKDRNNRKREHAEEYWLTTLASKAIRLALEDEATLEDSTLPNDSQELSEPNDSQELSEADARRHYDLAIRDAATALRYALLYRKKLSQ
jgi:hypothetical protein